MSDEFPSYDELKGMQTREILIMVVGKIRSLGINQCNHLKHHEEREKEDRRFNRTMIVTAIAAIFSAIVSLVIAFGT